MFARYLVRHFARLLVAAVLVANAGCGQKGDLYLPDEADRQDLATR